MHDDFCGVFTGREGGKGGATLPTKGTPEKEGLGDDQGSRCEGKVQPGQVSDLRQLNGVERQKCSALD